MHYCISDIHGLKDKYEKVLNYIKEDDTLYILGDVIDRGKYGIDILKDIMTQKNIIFLIGNHELFLYNYLDAKEREDAIKLVETKSIWNLDCNGGKITNKIVDTLSKKEQSEIKTFLENSYLIKRVEINNKKYHLSHSYTIPYIKEDLKFKNATNQERKDVVWSSIFPRRSDPFGKTLKNTNEIYVFGHTPVQKIRNDINFEIIHDYKKAEFFDIDSGCAYQESFSRLSLFCLEDNSVKYF